MFQVPSISELTREQLQRDLVEKGVEVLHAELVLADPETAARIPTGDRYRISRALELWREHQIRLSELRKGFMARPPAADFGSPVLKMGLKVERTVLANRVRARVAAMLKAGLIEETEALCGSGLADWTPLRSVGYQEVQMFLRGELTRSELAERIVISTMQLAKRQMTWFRRDAQVIWLEAGSSADRLFCQARELMTARLQC